MVRDVISPPPEDTWRLNSGFGYKTKETLRLGETMRNSSVLGDVLIQSSIGSGTVALTISRVEASKGNGFVFSAMP